MRCAEAVSVRAAEVDSEALADALYLVMQTPLGFGTLATIAPERSSSPNSISNSHWPVATIRCR